MQFCIPLMGKFYLNILLIVSLYSFMFIYYFNNIVLGLKSGHEYSKRPLINTEIVNDFYEKRKSWKTSKLGSILYKNEDYPELTEEKAFKTYVILIWKDWPRVQNHFLYRYSKFRNDPLEECSVNNCFFSDDENYLNAADAVLSKLRIGHIPKTNTRNLRQKWIFWDEESPIYIHWLNRYELNLTEISNIYNWSMTYRFDSDIPVPYGRTVVIESPYFLTKPLSEIVPNWSIKRRDVLVAVLISNCKVPYRQALLHNLKKILNFHFYGKCGDENLKTSCPGHQQSDCKVLSKYLFYLAFENSMCKEYMTEKVFYNAYLKGAIPIIQGPSVDDCERFLPPNSYLHLDNYKTIQDLVNHIKKISKNDETLFAFHKWRYVFEIRNEHGFFGSKSTHLCRICEAMNYNDMTTSIYDEHDMTMILSPGALCTY